MYVVLVCWVQGGLKSEFSVGLKGSLNLFVKKGILVLHGTGIFEVMSRIVIFG